METKPIKRSKHILQLSKDHHFSLLFCWKIRQGLKNEIEAGRINKYVQFFWENDMEEHFREEEEILFAPLQDEKVQKAVSDHRQIKSVVEKLQSTSAVFEMNKLLSEIANIVEAHVRFEERDLFPHLEKHLSDAQLEEIGEHLKGHAPGDDYGEKQVARQLGEP